MIYKLVNRSVLFLGALFTLTSCYTQLGYVNREYSSEDYDYSEDAYAEEYDQEDISVVYNVYVPPYYDTRQIYFDPYDAWYFQPGFSYYLGYYSGPVFYPDYGYHIYPYEVYYYPGYIHYNPYYGYHHGYYNGYYDGYYHGYYPTHYASYSRPLERRDFSRRSENNLANRKSIERRSTSGDIAYVGDKRPSGNSPNLVPAKAATKTRSGQSTSVDRLPLTKRSDSYVPSKTKQKTPNQNSQRTSSSGSNDSNTNQRQVKSSTNEKSYNQENSNTRRETSSISSSGSKSNTSGSRISSTPSSRQSTPSYRPASSSSSQRSSGTPQKSSSTASSSRSSSGKAKRR